MNLIERISAFSRLGKQLRTVADMQQDVFTKAEIKNKWFTQENIKHALAGICYMLDEDKLTKWSSGYSFQHKDPKVVGIAMAGNIPLVGFHDYLCILMSGHRAQIKLSSQDDLLLPYIHETLLSLEPRFNDQLTWVDKLSGYDAAIATGSDNTGRYFSYYFKEVPHIIRKNRTSCAIVLGEETEDELDALGEDVFTYFGLGCRNVSKIYIPEEYDLIPLLRCWEKFAWITNHNKYANNYTYQKSIHLINQKHFYDNGACLLIEDARLVSPIAVVYYEKYGDQEDLKQRISKWTDKIQCIVSARGWYQESIAFGKAQTPEVWDYADNIDTMKFLSKLN